MLNTQTWTWYWSHLDLNLMRQCRADLQFVFVSFRRTVDVQCLCHRFIVRGSLVPSGSFYSGPPLRRLLAGGRKVRAHPLQFHLVTALSCYTRVEVLFPFLHSSQQNMSVSYLILLWHRAHYTHRVVYYDSHKHHAAANTHYRSKCGLIHSWK